MRTTAEAHSETDRWGKEIEYQKVYGLTPTEAGLYVLAEAGTSASEIASTSGLSVQTVRNTLTNARKKIRGGGQMELYIIKYVPSTESVLMKTSIMSVISQLCKKTTDIKIDNLKHIIRMSNIDKSVPGDIEWMNANVFRFIDFIGTRNDVMSEERAERMAQMYRTKMHEQGITKPMMGYAVLKYWLDHYYIQYDTIEV